ncbi:MAG: hypothetical protein LBL65_01880 [Campylobacteraceae bacterium]|jgi:hypothetical protein|nr:hypothetical protein [Campylobacteraceae bacterium]
MLSSMINFKALYRLNLKVFFLLLGFFLIGCGSESSSSVGNSSYNSSEISKNDNSSSKDKSSRNNVNTNANKGGTDTSGLCGDISYEGVKKTTNFPLYDLPANTFPRAQVFNYYPIPNISSYDTLLQGNGLTLYQSNDTVRLYAHYSGDSLLDIGVITRKNNDDSYTVIINYKSNPSLLSTITPAGASLKQYQLTEFYTGERTFVINHIAQYKNSLKGLGFKDIGDSYGAMEKKAGNCVYRWFYQHQDHHYLNANNGYIDYNWVVVDKTFDDLE